ncbi:NAD(P)/FAD-dependent oxidoreductase [Hyphomonas sp.]|uniref:NAD(P)/FAD-dependent oxidoreductase n=1 Tax=Hyphomonas sp. TaxID=87 RepID=UPI00391A0B18
MRIAVIGAGIAGLAAARKLANAGLEISVFDKGRGPGGRMASRRVLLEGREVSFDHGAQYFTARDPAFRAAVEGWIAEGAVAAWSPRRLGGLPGEAWYVGQPGMNAVIRSLSGGLAVSWSTRVTAITGAPGEWWLQMEDGLEEGPFSRVIVAVPAEQAAPLLAGPAPALSEAAGRIRSLPCWTAMLVHDVPLGIELDAIEPPPGASLIAWAARGSSKPGRADADAWVVQAAADWSSRHIELTPEEAASLLAAEFSHLTRAPVPAFITAHRWRYARVAEPLGQPFMADADLSIATCGDWHLGARVEAAWLSGHTLAEHLLRPRNEFNL